MLKKSTKVITSIIFIFLLFLSANVQASTFNDNQVVDKNKNWTIEFNQEVLFESAQEGIKIIDSEGKDVDISLDFGQDEKTIIVNAPMGGYIEGESYTLIIDSNVKSKSGKLLKEKIEFRFNIKNKEDNIEENDEVMIIKELMSIDEPVNKTIIIPEDINDIIVDFNGQQVKELIVKGDRNTIKNATIVKLNIGETVDNLYLENISDTDGSEHIFNGGGGHSIKLQGNTTFKGKVKITSGVDIQIKAESEDAKIEGTVSVESSAKTTISAPVSNLVVDTENSQVVINAKVDKVAVRNDATITVNKGIDAPTIEARIGTTVTAIDEEGEEVKIAVEYALDTYELDLNISEAKYRIENVLEGPYDGNVAEGEKEKLSIALDEAQRALEDKEATKENQENIDRAAKELEFAIKEFDSKKTRVDKWELNQLIHDVDIFLNHSGIVIGEDIGNYPEESYDEFKEVFDEIREYLNGNKVPKLRGESLPLAKVPGTTRLLDTRGISQESLATEVFEGVSFNIIFSGNGIYDFEIVNDYGTKVYELKNNIGKSGLNIIYWDGLDLNNMPVEDGQYNIRLLGQNYTFYKKSKLNSAISYLNTYNGEIKSVDINLSTKEKGTLDLYIESNGKKTTIYKGISLDGNKEYNYNIDILKYVNVKDLEYTRILVDIQ